MYLYVYLDIRRYQSLAKLAFVAEQPGDARVTSCVFSVSAQNVVVVGRSNQYPVLNRSLKCFDDLGLVCVVRRKCAVVVRQQKKERERYEVGVKQT